MEDKQTENESPRELTEQITPWFIMTLIKPILADELVATFRYDRSGIRIAFSNGQKFRLTVTEI